MFGACPVDRSVHSPVKKPDQIRVEVEAHINRPDSPGSQPGQILRPDESVERLSKAAGSASGSHGLVESYVHFRVHICCFHASEHADIPVHWCSCFNRLPGVEPLSHGIGIKKNIYRSKKYIYRIKNKIFTESTNNICFAMKSLGIPSRVGGRSSGPLVPWSSGPLVPWSSGPLVRWSAGPATKSALQGPQSPAPATNSTLPHQKLLRLPRNLHSKATKSCTCHEICTSRSTKSCTCHEICTLRSTKKSCACHEICTPRPIKSCAFHWPPILHFNIHKVLRLPRNVHCKIHKVLHLPRNTTTTTTILLLLVRLLLLLLLLFGILFLIH